MDGGAWWATAHGVAKSQTRLSDSTTATENPPANAGDMRHGFNPWVGKITWRRAW